MGVKGGRSKNDTCVALTKFEKNTDVFFSLNLGFTLFCNNVQKYYNTNLQIYYSLIIYISIWKQRMIK